MCGPLDVQSTEIRVFRQLILITLNIACVKTPTVGATTFVANFGSLLIDVAIRVGSIFLYLRLCGSNSFVRFTEILVTS